MLIVTTETIVGRRIVATLGQVVGLAIRTRGIEGNIMVGLAGLPAINGDSMGEFLASLMGTRTKAIAQMAEQATALGANAVLGLRFDAAVVGHDMGEVVAYGTAVLIEPMPQPTGTAPEQSNTGNNRKEHRDGNHDDCRAAS